MAEWIKWNGPVYVFDPQKPPQPVCIDCGHPIATANHHLICDCETCDVPSDLAGLEHEMNRRNGLT